MPSARPPRWASPARGERARPRPSPARSAASRGQRPRPLPAARGRSCSPAAAGRARPPRRGSRLAPPAAEGVLRLVDDARPVREALDHQLGRGTSPQRLAEGVAHALLRVEEGLLLAGERKAVELLQRVVPGLA